MSISRETSPPFSHSEEGIDLGLLIPLPAIIKICLPPPDLRHALPDPAVGVMAGTLTLEVAPPGGYLLPLGYSRKPPKRPPWGATGNLAGRPLSPPLQGSLKPGLRERTWVLGRDAEPGRPKGLQVAEGPLRRSQPQRSGHLAPRIPE